MKNTIGRTLAGLIYQSQRALPGVLANLAPLGYTAAQGETFGTRITDAIAARDAHAVGKVAFGNARSAHKALVKTARKLVMTARDGLMPFLGREHSVAWSEAGFASNLQVGRYAPQLLANVQGLKAYLGAHAAHENAVLEVTAVRFTTLATDLIAAIAALDAAQSALITLAKDRDAKAKLLQQELRTLLSKLRVSFEPFAAMWESVGFNRPGFMSVPAVSSNLIATLLSANSALLKWDAAARAERYRIYKKVVGVDADFVLVGTREALDILLEGLPANAVTQLAVMAVNSGGTSVMSEPITVVTT